jgi:hypothetical protein
MRKAGFYWIKYNGRWQIAECIEWWPTISDGTHEMRWLLTGKKRVRLDREFDSINEEQLQLFKFVSSLEFTGFQRIDNE